MSGTREDTYAFYISSADPDDDPEWVDLTDRVREDEQPMSALAGRQNDLNEGDTGRFQAQLDNDNDDFTYGNESSPYAAWWGPGRKCQLRETVAGTELDMWTGYLETPTEVIETAQVDDVSFDRKRVGITAVDRMGRLETSEPFPSTLAAHIIGSARNDILSGYWPLLNTGLYPWRMPTPLYDQTKLLVDIFAGQGLDRATGAFLGEGDRIPADDADPMLFVPGIVGGLVTNTLSAYTGQTGLSLVPGHAVTVVAWISVPSDWSLVGYSYYPLLVALSNQFGASLGLTVRSISSGTDRYFEATCTGDLTATATAALGSANATDRYYMLGVRVDRAANELSLWVDDTTTTATPAGTLGGFLTIADITTQPVGSMAHLQIYAGDPDDFTHDDFLAQRQVGLTGLARQATGDRIRAMALYAGVPESELLIDTGQAIMQAASLAGKNPLEAMREAEAVERGLLYVDGSGRLVFKDRRTLYNI